MSYNYKASSNLQQSQSAVICDQVFKLRCAIARDLSVDRSLSDYLHFKYIDLIDQIPALRVVESICNLVTSNSLSEFSNQISIKDISLLPPLTQFELFINILHSKVPKQLINKAYILHPTSPRLLSQLISFNFGNSRNWLKKNFLHGNFIYQDHKKFVFTPLVQISIGHFFLILNLIALRRSKGLAIAIDFFAANSLGVELLYMLENESDISINILNHEQLINKKLTDISDYYDCNDYSDWVSVAEQRSAEEYFTQSNPIHNSNELYVPIHLRTGKYKLDDHSFHAKVRSVDPDTYSFVIERLRARDDKELLVSAGDVSDISEKWAVLCVSDSFSDKLQWQLIKNSQYFIGTNSGISHLAAINGGCVLLTNFLSLSFYVFLSRYHLICCKRIFPKPSIYALSQVERLLLYCGYWEIDGGLLQYIEYRDLTPMELVNAYDEFIDWKFSNKKPRSLEDVISEVGLSQYTNNFPVRYLSKTTEQDLVNLLVASN